MKTFKDKHAYILKANLTKVQRQSESNEKTIKLLREANKQKQEVIIPSNTPADRLSVISGSTKTISGIFVPRSLI